MDSDLYEHFLSITFGLFVYLFSLSAYEFFIKSNWVTLKYAKKTLNRFGDKLRNRNPDGSVRLFDYEYYAIQRTLKIFRQQRFKVKILKISMILIWSISFNFFGFQYIFDLLFPDKTQLIAPILSENLFYTEFMLFVLKFIGLAVAFVMVVLLARMKKYPSRKKCYYAILGVMLITLLFKYAHLWISSNSTSICSILYGGAKSVLEPSVLQVQEKLQSGVSGNLLSLRGFMLIIVGLWVFVVLYTKWWRVEILLKVLFYAGCFEVVKIIFRWVSPGLADILVPLLIAVF